jgi:hypothetical protein
VRYFRVDRRHIAYLRFILEGYDGLASLTTIDPHQGIVALSIPEYFVEDVNGLLVALAGETGITEIRWPEAVPLSPNQENAHDA